MRSQEFGVALLLLGTWRSRSGNGFAWTWQTPCDKQHGKAATASALGTAWLRTEKCTYLSSYVSLLNGLSASALLGAFKCNYSYQPREIWIRYRNPFLVSFPVPVHLRQSDFAILSVQRTCSSKLQSCFLSYAQDRWPVEPAVELRVCLVQMECCKIFTASLWRVLLSM